MYIDIIILHFNTTGISHLEKKSVSDCALTLPTSVFSWLCTTCVVPA